MFSLGNLYPLLEPKTGFVPQLEAIIGDKKSFEKKYSKELTRDEWQEKCFRYYAYLKNTFTDIKADSGAGKTKDHLERIEEIYKLPNPLAPVELMLERMLKHHVEGDSSHENYLRAKAMAIFGVMIECPLRAKNMVNLVGGKSDKAECLFFEGGRWHLLAPAETTKNKKTIEVSLHPNSNKYINPYWELKQKSGNTGGSFFELYDQSHLGAVMTKFAAAFIPEYAPKGINPHGMRHLVGTYCAKVGLGMEVAAGMLFDEIATVAKFYAHLQPQELANQYFEKKYGKR
jgi:integrase